MCLFTSSDFTSVLVVCHTLDVPEIVVAEERYVWTCFDLVILHIGYIQNDTRVFMLTQGKVGVNVTLYMNYYLSAAGVLESSSVSVNLELHRLLPSGICNRVIPVF